MAEVKETKIKAKSNAVASGKHKVNESFTKCKSFIMDGKVIPIVDGYVDVSSETANALKAEGYI